MPQTQPQKMNQILAVEKTLKGQAENAFTTIHQELKKKEIFQGTIRTYRPKADDGEHLPPERKFVMARVEDQFAKVQEVLGEYFDLTATKDMTNTVARADVIVNGEAMLKDVPATHLLWLENKLVDIMTLIRSLPALDPAYKWEFDKQEGVYRTAATQSLRTAKVTKFTTVAPATKEHPAQIAKETEDVTVGTWETTHMSGAIPASRIEELIRRVQTVQKAVKVAREQANVVGAVQLKSSPILQYIFAAQ